MTKLGDDQQQLDIATLPPCVHGFLLFRGEYGSGRLVRTGDTGHNFRNLGGQIFRNSHPFSIARVSLGGWKPD